MYFSNLGYFQARTVLLAGDRVANEIACGGPDTMPRWLFRYIERGVRLIAKDRGRRQSLRSGTRRQGSPGI